MDRIATKERDTHDAEASAPEDARAAGLRYVDDRAPGITRKATQQGFRYIGSDGAAIRDEAELARIRSLAIPPAWTEVWICRWRNGHLQATGRDAKGRKQYRYHPQWRNVRDEAKYERMLDFGRALPTIRSRIDTALSLPGLPREKVLAAIVYLLQATLMRIGNREYARDNDSYGMTTLRKKHVRVDGTQIRFEFRGKSGIRHSIRLQDRRLARIIMRTRDLPGQDLFQYVDEEGQRHAISSTDVNDYLRELTGQDYTAKDFRTWAGTVLAAMALLDCEPCSSETQGKKMVVQAIAAVAQKLGNTPAICRKCYVHPRIIEAYMEGVLTGVVDKPITDGALSPEETMVLKMLEKKTSVMSVAKNGTHRHAA
jgi:DNA topoisomerase-1